jgi:hypothetical protein
MSVVGIHKIAINSAKWRAFRHVNKLDLEAVGLLFQDISARAIMGDVDWVMSLPFVDDVTMESPRRVYNANIHPAVRQKVLSVGECFYCGATDDLSIDHIIPRSKGGSDEEANLQCLCLPCNMRKGNRVG